MLNPDELDEIADKEFVKSQCDELLKDIEYIEKNIILF